MPYKQEIHRVTFDVPLDLWAALQEISQRDMIPIAAVLRSTLVKTLKADIDKVGKRK